jgi:hypothetical protein
MSDVEALRCSIQGLETNLDVAQSYPVTSAAWGCVHRGTIIRHQDAKLVKRLVDLYCNVPSLGSFRYPMLDGVLHQRLKQQIRYSST